MSWNSQPEWLAHHSQWISTSPSNLSSSAAVSVRLRDGIHLKIRQSLDRLVPHFLLSIATFKALKRNTETLPKADLERWNESITSNRYKSANGNQRLDVSTQTSIKPTIERGGLISHRRRWGRSVWFLPANTISISNDNRLDFFILLPHRFLSPPPSLPLSLSLALSLYVYIFFFFCFLWFCLRIQCGTFESRRTRWVHRAGACLHARPYVRCFVCSVPTSVRCNAV